jgi:hypothetical protein
VKYCPEKYVHGTDDKGIKNLKWLQPKKMRKTFNEYMFFVGVMMDSTGSCRHAVTIFRHWIYDSNEPFALPLSKENLDCCTWTVKDGTVQEASSEAAKTKSRHILLGQYLQNFFNYYLVFMGR